MSNLYLGLVHYPIKNKKDELVTTSVTNLDIHDISRSCRTYGVEKYFIITPLEAQHSLVQRILGHWEKDCSAAYNPDRQDALSIASLSHSVDLAIKSITERERVAPRVVLTGANFDKWTMTTREMRRELKVDNLPYFLLFGTGWGLHASLLERFNLWLDPISGQSRDGYNHLSVRSAVAIYLDRLLGEY